MSTHSSQLGGTSPSHAIHIDTDTASDTEQGQGIQDFDSDSEGGMQLDPPEPVFQLGGEIEFDARVTGETRDSKSFFFAAFGGFFLKIPLCSSSSPDFLISRLMSTFPSYVSPTTRAKLTAFKDSDLTTLAPNPNNHLSSARPTPGEDKPPPPRTRTRMREEEHAALVVLNDWELLVTYALNSRRVRDQHPIPTISMMISLFLYSIPKTQSTSVDGYGS